MKARYFICFFSIICLSFTGCGLKTGNNPTTMNIMLDPLILRSLDQSKIKSDLSAIFTAGFFANTGTPPAALVSPAVVFPTYRYSPVTIKRIKYTYRGQSPADFIAINHEFNIAGLQPLGRPSATYNGAQIFSTTGIQLLTGNTYTRGGHTFTVTKAIASHIEAYTIAHELGWHKIAGHIFEGSEPPIHIGVNKWDPIIGGGFILNGLFPPFLNNENEKLQLRMGYLEY